MDEQKKLGRPPLPEDQKQKYQRVALYPETHAEAKKLSEKSGMKLIDWFDALVKDVSKKKKFPFFK